MPLTYSACNDCNTLNKFDSARGDKARCGRCKAPLPVHGAVTEQTDASLSSLVSSSPVPVVVDFWAPWCGPCRSFAPTFEKAASVHASKVVFAKVNTENEQAVGARYGIRGIPTLLVFSGGKEVARVSGAMDLPSFERWLGSSVQL